jgi:hypothetical protein
LNPWLPPCERVGGERHANLHLRSSRRTVRSEVRRRDEGELPCGAFVTPTADSILKGKSPDSHPLWRPQAMRVLIRDRRPSAVLTVVFAGRNAPWRPQLCAQSTAPAVISVSCSGRAARSRAPIRGRSARSSRSMAEICPVSPDLARRHLADLRRARSAETASSWLSHLIWPVRAILSLVSH